MDDTDTLPEKTKRSRFDDKTIAKIRKLRAEVDKEGKPKHTHAALAIQFETTAGVISQIVRNRTYVDPDYKPVNDGK